jgi:hypothetical protein
MQSLREAGYQSVCDGESLEVEALEVKNLKKEVRKLARIIKLRLDGIERMVKMAEEKLRLEDRK